jgi:hydroxyquinol 1,2-dioxygenase
MRNVTKDNITQAFVGYFGPDTKPRTRFLMERLADHLHDFVRETNLTHEEWEAAIAFLMETGDITTPERNEFVLLSDVLGLSSRRVRACSVPFTSPMRRTWPSART